MPVSITVVIPVKDDADPLAACLRALAAQTVAPAEIVVVDNGSVDDGADVARAAGARVVRCSAPGIPAASAAGYDAATGDVVARLDADCIPSATWIADVADAFAAYPEAAAITGTARFIDGPRVLRRSLAAAYLGTYYATTWPLLGHATLFGSNMALRRGAWEGVRTRVHRDDDAVHDDLDLAIHLGERGIIRYHRGLEMGISMRPFASARSLLRRCARGAHTIGVHPLLQLPPWRWYRCARAAADARAAVGVSGHRCGVARRRRVGRVPGEAAP